MTYCITILTKGKNYSGAVSYKGYRKDLKKCITAAQNSISSELLNRKDIVEIRISIYSYGKKVYGWKYVPTIIR
jgi:hypothetical protein